MLKKVIVVGGGLAGLTAAHTVIESGCSVLLLEKNSFCSGVKSDGKTTPNRIIILFTFGRFKSAIFGAIL